MLWLDVQGRYRRHAHWSYAPFRTKNWLWPKITILRPGSWSAHTTIPNSDIGGRQMFLCDPTGFAFLAVVDGACSAPELSF